jgi:hypothetical protein
VVYSIETEKPTPLTKELLAVPRGEVIAFRCSPKRASILRVLADETDETVSGVVRRIINEALPLPDEPSPIAMYRAIAEQSKSAA